MTALVITKSILSCDGCQAKFGVPDGYPSPTEVRAAACQPSWDPAAAKPARDGYYLTKSELDAVVVVASER